MGSGAQSQATDNLGYVPYEAKGSIPLEATGNQPTSSWPRDAGEALGASARSTTDIPKLVAAERLNELTVLIAARPEISPPKQLPEHDLAATLTRLLIETEAKGEQGRSWLSNNLKNLAITSIPVVCIAGGLALIVWGIATGHGEGALGLVPLILGGGLGSLAASETVNWKRATPFDPWSLPDEGYKIMEKLTGKDDPKVADALLGVLHGKVNDGAKIAAAKALEGIPSARDSLIKTLHSENYELASAAFKSLGQLVTNEEICAVGRILLSAKENHSDTVKLPAALLGKSKQGEFYLLKFIENGPKQLVNQRRAALELLDPHSLEAIKLARKLASGTGELAKACYEFLRK